jgi:hypothetical protein
LPALADAFAALLAAEQDEPLPADAPAWPASSPGPVDTDALVDEVARRVLDRLSGSGRFATRSPGLWRRSPNSWYDDEIDKIKAALK